MFVNECSKHLSHLNGHNKGTKSLLSLLFSCFAYRVSAIGSSNGLLDRLREQECSVIKSLPRRQICKKMRTEMANNFTREITLRIRVGCFARNGSSRILIGSIISIANGNPKAIN